MINATLLRWVTINVENKAKFTAKVNKDGSLLLIYMLCHFPQSASVKHQQNICSISFKLHLQTHLEA